MKIVNGRNDLDKNVGVVEPNNLNVIVYATKVKIGGKNNSIFEENAYTVLYCDTTKSIRKEAFGISKSINTDIVSKSSRIDGTTMSLQNHTTYKLVMEDTTDKLDSDETTIYTMGEPLNIANANSGVQNVYVARQLVPSKINQDANYEFIANDAIQQIWEDIDDKQNLTTIDLIDIELINNISNSSIIFNEYIDTTNTSVKDFVLSYDKSFALAFNNGVIINGSQNGDRRRLFLLDNDDNKEGTGVYKPDAKLENNLLLTKIIPVDDTNGIVALNETIDFNVNLPFEVMKNGIDNGINVRDFIVSSDDAWKKDLYQTILGALEMTKAYANYFSEYLKTGTDGKVGIDPDAKIATKKVGLLGGTNATDAVSSVDGLMIDFDSAHPGFIDTNEYKFAKAVLLYLTPWVQSSNSLGKGLNKLNRIYQLFHFNLITSITKGLADDASKALTVKPTSIFFDFNKKANPYLGIAQNSIKNETDQLVYSVFLKKELWNYTRPKSFDIDGQITLAQAPKQWSAMNRPAKAGDVSLTSDDISRYYFYVPSHKWNNTSSYYGEIVSNDVVNNEYTEKLITITTTDGKAENGYLSGFIPNNFIFSSEQSSGQNNNNINNGLALGLDGKAYEINKKSPDELVALIRDKIPKDEVLEIVNNTPHIEVYKLQTSGITVNGNSNATGNRKLALQPGFENPKQISSGYFTHLTTDPNNSNRLVSTDYSYIQISYQIRYWSKTLKPTSLASIIASNPLITKGDYVDIVNGLCFPPANLLPYDQNLSGDISLDKILRVPLASKGEKQFENIDQVVVNGLWGEYLNLKIEYANGSVIDLRKVPMLSSRDETQSTTKINL